jgi:hypothetical protein
MRSADNVLVTDCRAQRFTKVQKRRLVAALRAAARADAPRAYHRRTTRQGALLSVGLETDAGFLLTLLLTQPTQSRKQQFFPVAEKIHSLQIILFDFSPVVIRIHL